jgi:DNA end-binding protein Ku
MWSGTITFGLVSVPVALYPALRSRPVHVRLLAKGSGPLKRRYYCPKDGKELDREEIIRGFEKDGTFITVEDEELNALEPRKSSDIELKQFVPVDEVEPFYFERPYFLAPTGRSTKAYRLLVHVMERSARVGISTFIMDGKEYLAAILSENGLLMVETLRYRDEIRSPEQIGLPEAARPDKDKEKSFTRILSGLKRNRFSGKDMEDRYAKRFQELVMRKKKSRKAVVEVQEKEEPRPEEFGQVIDFVSIFKERFAAREKVKRARRTG